MNTMRQHRNSYHWSSFFVLAAILFLSTGCDQAREKMAAAIKPVTVEDVTAAVNEKIDHQQFRQAQAEGEKFLDGKADVSGHLAWAIARASAQSGDHDLAIRYTEQALSAHAVTGPQAMAEPLMEPVRTDIRFVSLLAGIGQTQAPLAQANSSPDSAPVKKPAPSTAIRMDGQGIEVKAGNIAIKLPN